MFKHNYGFEMKLLQVVDTVYLCKFRCGNDNCPFADSHYTMTPTLFVLCDTQEPGDEIYYYIRANLKSSKI